MQQAVPVGEGRMLAVIGRELDVAAVERAIGGLAVTVANDNSPEQVGRASCRERVSDTV